MYTRDVITGAGCAADSTAQVRCCCLGYCFAFSMWRMEEM
jgi:hypothetical protein